LLLRFCFLVFLLCCGVSAQQAPESPPKRSFPAHLESRLTGFTAGAGKVLALPLGIETTDGGRIVIVIEPPPGTESAVIDISSLETLGARVTAQSRHLLQVEIPPEMLHSLGDVYGVHFVRPPIRPLRQVVSQGVSLSGADEYHDNGLVGAGVKVAVIDDGFTGANRMASEIPNGVVVRSFSSGSVYAGSVHGAACAEIVHDVAPGAELYLLRVENLLQLENAKDYAIANGVDIISHSMAWLGTGFGDGRGLACEIVDDATENGILWVNSAGNYARRQYSGLWADSDSDGWHNFRGDGEVLELADVAAGDTMEVWLTWNDWPTTTNDYDLSLVWETSTGSFDFMAESRTTQRGTKPVETVEFVADRPGRYYVVVRKMPEARGTVLKLWSANHDLEEQSDLIGNIGTPADARGSFSIGAVAHFNWERGTIEPFSSVGPTADGRFKPDLVAPDGVNSASYPTGFFGTSAAAPHVAGAAALMLSANPSLGVDNLKDEMTSEAVDAGVRGTDNTFGAGLLSMPQPPRFDTEVHTPGDGFWEFAGGTIDADNKRWRFTSYFRQDASVIVNGTLSVTFVNTTDVRLKMRYDLRFLSSSGEELADIFVPGDSPLELAAGESKQITDLGFTASFGSLTEVERVERVAVFAGFDEIAEPPVAAFTPSVTSGEAPLTVRFANMSTGTIGVTDWVFGDGATSRQTDPSHTFTEPGTYRVVLRVANDGGGSSTSVDINVLPPASGRLLVRAIISGREYQSSADVSVNRRVNFQVLRHTREDLGDTTEVTGFTMTVPPSLGSATSATGFRVGTVAGVTEAVIIEYEGLRGEFVFTTVPAKVIDRIVIEPSEVTLAPGESVDFRAVAVDRYGNSYPAKGTVLWTVLPSEMGSIVERTGRFSAGDWSGEGYVVAFAVYGLEFGSTETSAQGSGKVTIGPPLPREFALHQNHPNPFNPGTQISFDIPRASMVRLDIYNMAGQWIERLVEEALVAGQHTVKWTPTGLPTGVYIYRLHAEGYVEIRKMLMIR
jgi:PKD repeat protein/subtilisin family serine protease